MSKFFAFTSVTEVVKYHTLIIDAETAEEAEKIVKERFREYLWSEEEHPKLPAQVMSPGNYTIDVTIKPVKPHHNVPD